MNEQKAYRIVPLPKYIDASQTKLNDLHKEGWEVISTFYHPFFQKFDTSENKEEDRSPIFLILKKRPS